MAFTLSPDQQSIVDSRHQNIVVSAAAGSGKTRVLTERIISRVLDTNDPVDIDHVLVVTFTKAAAQEMRTRISQALDEALSVNPENAHLQRQTNLIHNAQITTIDSFCLNIVKNNFHKIDLDPSFRPAANGEGELLAKDVMKEVIKKHFEEHDEAFYYLVDCYGGKSDEDSIESAISSIYKLAMSCPSPVKWLMEHKSDYDCTTVEELEASGLLKAVKDYVLEEIKYCLPIVEEVAELTGEPGGAYNYTEAIDADYDRLDRMISTIPNANLAVLAALKEEGWTAFSKKKMPDVSDEAKQLIKDRRKEYKNKVDAALSLFTLASPASMVEDMMVAGKNASKLVELTLEFMEEFSKAKRDRGIIDYHDMEHMALDILIEDYIDAENFKISDVAREYRKFFSEVMVDEYQDSNMVQEILIKSISREQDKEHPNRFVVGDVKQSIYRFRLARSAIFLRKMQEYRKDPAAHDRLITLKANYRSRKSIIDSVNAVFERSMNLYTSGMEYDDDARLYLGADYPSDTADNRSELLAVTGKMKAEDARVACARATVKRIKDMVGNFSVFDRNTGSMRPAEYKDIAILARSTNKWASSLKAAFEAENVPYHLDNAGAFYDSREIRDILDFLRILDNPLNDIALCGALTSYFGNLSDEDLARIKCAGTENDYYLWEKLKSYNNANPDDEKTDHFCKLIEKYRKLVKILPIQKLISTLLDETGYKNIITALPDGKQRGANVDLLIYKAGEYSKTSFYGLFHFLRYIELIKKADSDEGEANVFDENSDAVRIMTIHKSKGLEFPICFILGMEERIGGKEGGQFILDMEAGIGLKAIDPDKRTVSTTLRHKYANLKANKDAIAEEIRILYVALTRAKEKLIMVGHIEDMDKLTGGDKLDYKSYLDMVVSAILDNEGSLFEIKTTTWLATEGALVEKSLDRGLLLSELKAGSEEALELAAKLKKRFSFEYPHKNLENLYTKTTVSEVKMVAMEEEDEEAAHQFHANETSMYIPAFAADGEETSAKGTDRGTAYHNLMQLTAFDKYLENTDREKRAAELTRQKDMIIALGKMQKEDLELVYDGKVLKFLGSDLARRMGEAEKNSNLYKEQPFVLGIPANTMNPDFPSEEVVLIQGVIDAYFVEDGEVVILDYKTDRVDSGEELIKRYKAQLEYYASAVSKLTGLTVKEKLIYSFALNETIAL